MNDAEYIAALERDLKAATERVEYLEREFDQMQRHYHSSLETIRETVALNTGLAQRVETMRQIACAIASNTNKQIRIAAGETE